MNDDLRARKHTLDSGLPRIRSAGDALDLLARVARDLSAQLHTNTPAHGQATTTATTTDTVTIGVAHLRELLRYVAPENDDVAHVFARAFGNDLLTGEPATPQALKRLLAGDAPPPPHDSAIDPAVLGALRTAARRGTHAFLQWRVVLSATSQRAQWFRVLHDAITTAAPGQDQAARALAQSLALQLLDPTRKKPVVAFLSGAQGSGTRQAAQAILRVLAAHGFGTLEVEMQQLRHEGEAAEIDGQQPYWSGSRPGKVTGAIHAKPRTAVVFHDTDLTLSRVQACVLPAIDDGVLTDNYGLDGERADLMRESSGRKPTPVDCRAAVFVFTASHGHDELWRNPDLAEMVDAGDEDAQREVRESILASLRAGTRIHRNEELPVFEGRLLSRLEQYMVVFRPLRWAALHARAVTAITQACAEASQRLGVQVDVDPDAAPDLAAVFLASLGGRASLDRLTAHELHGAFIAPLEQALIDEELAAQADSRDAVEPGHVLLTMPATARESARALLAHAMPEPQTHLLRRRLAMRVTAQLERDALCWRIVFDDPRLVRVRQTADYTGQDALLPFVPDVSFDDVAGQDEAKRHLRRIVELYARADVLTARGLELPRGTVLYGPPGTGKTMLAQAFAAEAEMAFVPTSGTELLDPSRTRKIFELARANAPAIIFIDEADSLGKRGRHSNLHDAAITQLLTRIQGFDQRAPVFVLAATNRLDDLDAALTRPGRLERPIKVGLLDRQGREPMIDRLMALMPDAERIKPEARERLLAFSHRLSGAELSQVLRDARLKVELDASATITLDALLEELAAQKYGTKLDAGRRRVERDRVAIHEAGHAVLHAVFFPAMPIEQVTIGARAHAEGFMALNAEDAPAVAETPRSVRRFIAVLLAGRLAEVRRYGSEQGVSSGCASDFAQARIAAFKAVVHHGLDDEIDVLSLIGADDEDRSLLPDSLKQRVWDRIGVWLDEGKGLAIETLDEHWAAVQALADELLQREAVPGSRVQAIVERHRGRGDDALLKEAA